MPVEGVQKLTAALKAYAEKRLKSVKVEVGYSALYAGRVHEDLEMRHEVGQAKYLEQPARTEGPVMAAKVREVLAQGGTLEEALLAGGEVLLEASLALVPRKSGYLASTAFIRIVEEP